MPSDRVLELLNQIVGVRERRLERARQANREGGATTEDEIDVLEIEWLQARVEAAKAPGSAPAAMSPPAVMRAAKPRRRRS